MFVLDCGCASRLTFVLLSGFHFYLWVSLVPSPHWLCHDQKGNLNKNSITCLRMGSWSGSAGIFGSSLSHISHQGFPFISVLFHSRGLAIIGVSPYLFYPALAQFIYIAQSS